eukprot:Rmarinus@m.24478
MREKSEYAEQLKLLKTRLQSRTKTDFDRRDEHKALMQPCCLTAAVAVRRGGPVVRLPFPACQTCQQRKKSLPQDRPRFCVRDGPFLAHREKRFSEEEKENEPPPSKLITKADATVGAGENVSLKVLRRAQNEVRRDPPSPRSVLQACTSDIDDPQGDRQHPGNHRNDTHPENLPASENIPEVPFSDAPLLLPSSPVFGPSPRQIPPPLSTRHRVVQLPRRRDRGPSPPGPTNMPIAKDAASYHPEPKASGVVRSPPTTTPLPEDTDSAPPHRGRHSRSASLPPQLPSSSAELGPPEPASALSPHSASAEPASPRPCPFLADPGRPSGLLKASVSAPTSPRDGDQPYSALGMPGKSQSLPQSPEQPNCNVDALTILQPTPITLSTAANKVSTQTPTDVSARQPAPKCSGWPVGRVKPAVRPRQRPRHVPRLPSSVSTPSTSHRSQHPQGTQLQQEGSTPVSRMNAQAIPVRRPPLRPAPGDSTPASTSPQSPTDANAPAHAPPPPPPPSPPHDLVGCGRQEQSSSPDASPQVPSHPPSALRHRDPANSDCRPSAPAAAPHRPSGTSTTTKQPRAPKPRGRPGFKQTGKRDGAPPKQIASSEVAPVVSSAAGEASEVSDSKVGGSVGEADVGVTPMAAADLPIRWFEIGLLLRRPVDSDGDVKEAHAAACAGLFFLRRLEEVASRIGIARGVITRWILPFDANTDAHDQAASAVEGGVRLPPEAISNGLSESEAEEMVSAAIRLRKLIRVKIADENDLRQAQQAAEATASFFSGVLLHAEKENKGPIDLLKSFG